MNKQDLARWAIVQLAGRRILVPLIVVQVHVAQPTRITSPSSSRPRTAAFHAVNSGSNPLGDANQTHQGSHVFHGCLFCMGCSLWGYVAIPIMPQPSNGRFVHRSRLTGGSIQKRYHGVATVSFCQSCRSVSRQKIAYCIVLPCARREKQGTETQGRFPPPCSFRTSAKACPSGF